MSDKPIERLDFQGRLEVAAKSILSPTEFGRRENQDNYLLIDAAGAARYLSGEHQISRQIPNWPHGHIRLAVMDGLGGHSRGREAAEKTVEGLVAIPAQTDAASLAATLENLHARLHKEMHRRGEEPGCTLTLLEIPPSGPALLFHVGDSRLYRIGAEESICLTVDHVPMTKFAMMGMMSKEEWFNRVHAQSGYQISQAFVLGNTFSEPSNNTEALASDLFELHDGNLPEFLKGYGDRRLIELQPGSVYLLASDGLWHLPEPLNFIDHWPALLIQPDKPLDVQLNKLFAELIQQTRKEPHLQGDNSTAIAFRLRA